MASKNEIKNAILAVAGNPESGDIWELADQMAEAVLGLDSKAPVKTEEKSAEAEEPSKETRVIKPDFTR
jgi:hypothetical protein